MAGGQGIQLARGDEHLIAFLVDVDGLPFFGYTYIKHPLFDGSSTIVRLGPRPDGSKKALQAVPVEQGVEYLPWDGGAFPWTNMQVSRVYLIHISPRFSHSDARQHRV